MTDTAYLAQAEKLLAAVEANCDRINAQLDVDIDNQRTGNMVTLHFANGSEMVVNLQKPLQEVWLAARAGGFHYRLEDGLWRDTKNASEFFETVSRCASAQAGQPLEFTALPI